MSMIWLFFASMTVIGATAYNFAVKMSGDHINVFLFTTYLTIAAFIGHFIILLIYKYGFAGGESLKSTPLSIWMAIIAGLAVVVIDIGFFLAVKQGGIIPSQLFWTIGSTVLVAVMGVLYFKEMITLQTLIGMGLGLVSVWLIVTGK